VVTESAIGIVEIRSVAYGSGTWVVAGIGDDNKGRMVYSTDGETWTAVSDTTFGTTWISGVAYGNGTWVAGGAN
jgi:hypothetical protein